MSCIIYFVLVYPCFLRQQMFLAIEECRNQKGIGEQPCKRRGKTDDDVAKDRHQQEADHGAGDHFADTCQDGEQAVAHSLNRETPYIDDCQRYVEQGVEGQELVRLMDYNCFRGIDEEKRNHAAKHGQYDARRNGVDAADESRGPDALADAVYLSGTGVLSGVGCHRAAQCVKRAAEEHADLLTCGNGGNCDGT